MAGPSGSMGWAPGPTSPIPCGSTSWRVGPFSPGTQDVRCWLGCSREGVGPHVLRKHGLPTTTLWCPGLSFSTDCRRRQESLAGVLGVWMGSVGDLCPPLTVGAAVVWSNGTCPHGCRGSRGCSVVDVGSFLLPHMPRLGAVPPRPEPSCFRGPASPVAGEAPSPPGFAHMPTSSVPTPRASSWSPSVQQTPPTTSTSRLFLLVPAQHASPTCTHTPPTPSPSGSVRAVGRRLQHCCFHSC